MNPRELREQELEYCKGNIDYFVETYCHIEDKESAEVVQPFTLWPMQRDLLFSLYEHKLNVVLKARQLGVTWLALAIAAHLLVTTEGRTVVAISRTEEDSKELTRRLAFILRNMPELVAEEREQKAFDGPVFKATTLSIEIKHKGATSYWKAFPSAAGAGRGFSADILILDEWAFQQYAEEIWASIFPVVNRPYGGKVIGVSTIERGTLFENIVMNHEDNGFNLQFLPWYADPRRTQDWYDKTLKALGEVKMVAEYPATIEEALSTPGGSYFPEVKMSIHGRDEPFTDEVLRYISFDYGLDMFACHWYAMDARGNVRIYREICEPNLTISQACEMIKKQSGDEEIEMILAPHDMFNRESVTGKSRSDIFAEYGVPLTRVSKDFEAGCAAMKEYLRVDELTGRPKLTIRNAPVLMDSLMRIQKDKNRPKVYAKQPHELTHAVDALRGFCVFWVNGPEIINNRRTTVWTSDMMEDFQNANPKDREMLLRKYGNPRN